MAQKADKAGEVLASRKNELTVVAQDRNWRSYVSNELRCADQWASDWGFLGANSDRKFSHQNFPCLCPLMQAGSFNLISIRSDSRWNFISK